MGLSDLPGIVKKPQTGAEIRKLCIFANHVTKNYEKRPETAAEPAYGFWP